MAALWRCYESAMRQGAQGTHSGPEGFAKLIHRKLWILRGL